MSLEVCWTEQLGLNHRVSSQRTDVYRRGEKVKCYWYLGAFAQKKKKYYLFFCFFAVDFAAVCWTDLDFCPVPEAN